MTEEEKTKNYLPLGSEVYELERNIEDYEGKIEELEMEMKQIQDQIDIWQEMINNGHDPTEVEINV